MNMASYVPEIFGHPRFPLLGSAVLGGATVAAIILTYQALLREERVYELKNSIPPSTTHDELHRVRGRCTYA
jgi:hypothetical protein